MTYLDPKRLAKIEQFKRLVEGDRLEPYYSQLQQENWSLDRLLETYHQDYYRRYFQQSKTRRWQHFAEKCKSMLFDNPVNGGIYIVRTAVLEGLVPEPDAAQLKRLQKLWHYLLTGEGNDEYFELTNHYLTLLGLYYPQDPKERKPPPALKTRQARLAAQLAHHRQQIARRSLEGYGNQPLAPLWQWVMLFDQEEAEHLASLSDSDYYASDYWREFSQYYQQQHGDRCPFCGAQGLLFPHNPHREYHGQEFFLPQIVTCRCQQCTLALN